MLLTTKPHVSLALLLFVSELSFFVTPPNVAQIMLSKVPNTGPVVPVIIEAVAVVRTPIKADPNKFEESTLDPYCRPLFGISLTSPFAIDH